MGDAVMSTPLLDSLRRTYPDAQIDFVLNERIAPLFEGHPSISNIITFSDSERKGFLRYLRKVRRVVREGRYDVVIDMRTTANTALFALFARRSALRIGLDKPYLRWFYNRRVPKCGPLPMVEHNLRFAAAVSSDDSRFTRRLSLGIAEAECERMRRRMEQAGIDMTRPVVLAGVTTKLLHKEWPRQYMAEVLSDMLNRHPEYQVVMNYAPGAEEQRAREVLDKITEGKERVYMQPQAGSMRELAALAANCSFYFGNEGGARHIVQAMGRPSLAICARGIRPATWIPDYGDSYGIEGSVETVDGKEEYRHPQCDEVKRRLASFCEQLAI